MSTRERDPAPPAPQRFADLVLRSGPNWTGVCFLGMLGGLHLSIAIPSLAIGRWAGYISLIIGTVMVVVTLTIYRFRSEIAVLPGDRRVRLRTGLLSRFYFERFVPFGRVRNVRLTIESGGRRPTDSTLELVCDDEDILCPPSRIPRQQALLLAMMLGVPLVKAMEPDDVPSQEAERFELGAVRRAENAA